MKIVMTLAVMFMTTAIFAQKTTKPRMRSESPARSLSAVSTPVDQSNTKAIVRIDDKCGVRIQIRSKDGPIYFFPVNLPDDFKVDGTLIFLDYAKVNAKFNEGCSIVSAITVENVTLRKTSPN